MLKTRFLALVAAFAVGFVPMMAAGQVSSPVYRSGGVAVHATGIICLNLDGTSCTFGGGSGSLSAKANATAPTSAENATTDPISMDLTRHLRVVDDGVISALTALAIAPLPPGTNTIGAISPLAVTPTAPTATTLTTGGTAVTVVTGPYKGGYICNPATATYQGIGTAEDVFVNPVTTATAVGNGTNSPLAPGQCYFLTPGGTTNISAIAATSGHKLTAVVNQ